MDDASNRVLKSVFLQDLSPQEIEIEKVQCTQDYQLPSQYNGFL